MLSKPGKPLIEVLTEANLLDGDFVIVGVTDSKTPAFGFSKPALQRGFTDGADLTSDSQRPDQFS